MWILDEFCFFEINGFKSDHLSTNLFFQLLLQYDYNFTSLFKHAVKFSIFISQTMILFDELLNIDICGLLIPFLFSQFGVLLRAIIIESLIGVLHWRPPAWSLLIVCFILVVVRVHGWKLLCVVCRRFSVGWQFRHNILLLNQINLRTCFSPTKNIKYCVQLVIYWHFVL